MRDMFRSSARFALVFVCGLTACAAAQKPVPASAATEQVVAEPATAPSSRPNAPTTQQALVGTWVEFWALAGRADTQGYEFVADGHFEWHAAASSDDRMMRRWGRYRVQGAQLVLATEGHEERFGCEGSAVCRVLHEPALEERFALGECPANDEARTLDVSYTCVAIEGHAFWKVTRTR